MTIRSAIRADLERIAFIRNANWLEYPTTAADLEQLDAAFPTRERFVLEVNGEIVAHALIEPSGDSRVKLELDVLSAFQARGLGTAFWAFLEPRLAGCFGVVSVPEASESALRFALTRGFVEVRRSWHQVLDVQSFMDEGWLEVDGYEVRSYLEIADERQLFELYRVTSRDVPGATKLPSFDEYRQRTLESPLCLPGAYFVALRDHRWVAYTGTRQRALDRPLEWHTGMTGVLRAHRGRGLAMALKRRVIALARACGIRELHTNNDSSNAPMLEVNRKLGYRRCSGVIQLERSV